MFRRQGPVPEAPLLGGEDQVQFAAQHLAGGDPVRPGFANESLLGHRFGKVGQFEVAATDDPKGCRKDFMILDRSPAVKNVLLGPINGVVQVRLFEFTGRQQWEAVQRLTFFGRHLCPPE